ncbi:MAG TPA: ABC transporter substrate-binding protein [bacterium]|jgi:branched-chain amino acid transport system substrate-binding protein|nr:ABC transporter substrate-binding protein [bacterium]
MMEDTGRRSWAFLLLGVVLFAGCGGGASESAIRLGLIVPASSDISGIARAVSAGAELAVAEMNDGRGIHGRRLTLLVTDDRGDPEESARLVAHLAAQGVVAILGPVTDSGVLAASPAAERERVVIISPGATAPLPYGGHFVFRTATPAHRQAEAMAAYLVERLSARRIAVVHDSNEYGSLVALAFERAVRERGGIITSRRLYRDGEKDFSRHVRGILAERPQALFVAGYPDEAALLIRQARAAGRGLIIAGSDALYSEETAASLGAAANQVYVPAAFLPTVPLPQVRSFVAAYRRAYGRRPDQYAAQAYDGVKLIAVALRRAGTDRQRLRDAVAALRRVPGVTGEISFDTHGDPMRDIIITRVSGGRFVTAAP